MPPWSNKSNAEVPGSGGRLSHCSCTPPSTPGSAGSTAPSRRCVSSTPTGRNAPRLLLDHHERTPTPSSATGHSNCSGTHPPGPTRGRDLEELSLRTLGPVAAAALAHRPGRAQISISPRVCARSSSKATRLRPTRSTVITSAPASGSLHLDTRPPVALDAAALNCFRPRGYRARLGRRRERRCRSRRRRTRRAPSFARDR